MQAICELFSHGVRLLRVGKRFHVNARRTNLQSVMRWNGLAIRPTLSSPCRRSDVLLSWSNSTANNSVIRAVGTACESVPGSIRTI